MLVFYFTLLVVVCGCYGNDKPANSFGYGIVGSDYREGKERLYYPCDPEDDDYYYCISTYLEENSVCSSRYDRKCNNNEHHVSGFLPDPIYLPVEKFYLPVCSMTITHLNATVRGFRNAKISQYYVNEDTGNVILAVTIPTFNLSSEAYFAYHRTSKDTITHCDFATFEMDNIVLTAVIPKDNYLRLDLADIHADTHNCKPRFYIGPNAHKSNDPEVQAHFSEFTENIATVMKEVYTFHAYLLMTTFIQDLLCNFGLDPYRNYDGYALGKCQFETDYK